MSQAFPPKTCVVCNKEYRRRDNERESQYARRTTCSRACGIIKISANLRLQASIREPKYCVQCKKQLCGKQTMYCCRKCNADFEARRNGTQQMIGKWPDNVSFKGQDIEGEILLGRVGLPPIAFSTIGSSAAYTADRGEDNNEGKWKSRKTGNNHYVRS